MSLQLEGVSKDFVGFSLAPLNLTVNGGEFFSLLGPSGCGKTTVLRLIGGFETPTSGRIQLQGRDITGLAPHRRNIHTVFQRYALFPHLNVADNIAFGLRLKGLTKSEIDSKVAEALRLVEISDLRTRRIHQLSGGEAQRVALARALVDHPEVLLLDEPLSALDPSLRMKMREELKALCRKIGTTFLLVTHDQDEALQLSDRLAVLRDGKCLQIGTPKMIYEDPIDSFVARFIGPVNEITCEVSAIVDDQLLLNSPIGQIKVKKNGTPVSPSMSLILRPEKMRLLRQRSTTQDNLVEGEIKELCYLGGHTEYTVKTQDTVFKVSEQELERSKKRTLNVGDRIFLSWKSADGILLPKNGTSTD